MKKAHDNISMMDIGTEAPFHEEDPVVLSRRLESLARQAIHEGISEEEFVKDSDHPMLAKRIYRGVKDRLHKNPEMQETLADKRELDTITAEVPPNYKLNYVITDKGKRMTPRFPIAMFPGPGYEEVAFKYWGLDNYDLHTAFGGIQRDPDSWPYICEINYGIIIQSASGPGIRADFKHKFKKHICFGVKGIYAHRKIFELFNALEHLPKLPNDWRYMQFVG